MSSARRRLEEPLESLVPSSTLEGNSVSLVTDEVIPAKRFRVEVRPATIYLPVVEAASLLQDHASSICGLRVYSYIPCCPRCHNNPRVLPDNLHRRPLGAEPPEQSVEVEEGAGRFTPLLDHNYHNQPSNPQPRHLSAAVLSEYREFLEKISDLL